MRQDKVDGGLGIERLSSPPCLALETSAWLQMAAMCSGVRSPFLWCLTANHDGKRLLPNFQSLTLR